MIRLVLNEPKLAQTQLDAKLRTLKLSKIDVFWEIYDLFQNKPSMSIAYLMGLWHNTSKGETLTELAAKEFLLERQHTELEFHDALRQLEIILIDNEIERALAADSIDMSLIQDLLKNKHSPNLTKSES